MERVQRIVGLVAGTGSTLALVAWAIAHTGDGGYLYALLAALFVLALQFVSTPLRTLQGGILILAVNLVIAVAISTTDNGDLLWGLIATMIVAGLLAPADAI